MPDPQTQRQAVESYIRAYNEFDIDGMLRDLHPAVVFKNISNGETNLTLEGIDAFRKQAEQAAKLFDSREQTVTDLRINGPVVTVAIDYRAVPAADLPNRLKKGDVLELKGQSVFHFEGERIVEIRDVS